VRKLPLNITCKLEVQNAHPKQTGKNISEKFFCNSFSGPPLSLSHTNKEKERDMAGIGHVLVLPFPAQGHVNSLMRFSRQMAKHGLKITFVNTEYIHKRVVSSMPEEGRLMDSDINLVSIPDGLDSDDERNDMGKAMEALLRTVPARLEELIEGINASNGTDDINNITCILTDGAMGWAVEVADKMGIRGAIFWSTAAASSALLMSVPRLIDDGILNGDGKTTLLCISL